MEMERWLWRCLLAILFLAASSATAQQELRQPDRSVDAPKDIPMGGAVRFSDGGVTFEPVSLSSDPSIRNLAASGPNFSDSSQFSGLLSNSSGKSIVGTTSIVTWAGPSGALREYIYWVDYLLQYKGKIYAEEFSDLLIGPNSLLMKRVVNSPAYSVSRLFWMITLDEQEVTTLYDLKDSHPVKFELDAVILEDGTVLGPGRSQTLNVLIARQKAIDTVSTEMLALLDRQKDPTEMLKEYSTKEADLSDPVSFWSARVARIFLAAPNPRAVAAQLSENRNVVPHHNH